MIEDEFMAEVLQFFQSARDGAREAVYAEPDGASLRAARQHGFTVISMRTDWRRVFA